MERKDQTWNSSRGITFAGDTSRRVVGYPQLPSLTRYHSDSAASTASNPEPVLPLNDAPVPLGNPSATGTTLDSQGREFVDAQEALEEQLEVIIEDENVKSEDEGASLKPPFTPLSFTMTEDLFREAKKAAEGTPGSYWTYNLYRGPDKDGNMNEKVKVHYCRSANTTERVLKQYFMDDKILGLDLEWEANAKPTHGPRQNVSVIQIASEKRIGIFHISLYPKKDELGSPLLKQIIEDPDVIKTGVWILGDCTRLEKFLGIKGRGIQELSHLYKLVKYSASGEHKLVNRMGVPLARMVNEILQLPMFKGSVRTSAWSKPLNMDQILYSASDAYAGLKLPIRLAADVIVEEAGLLDEPLPDETVGAAALSADYLSTVGDNINPVDPLVSEATLWAQNYILSHQPPKPKEPRPKPQPVAPDSNPNPDSVAPADSPAAAPTTTPKTPSTYIRPPLSVPYLRAYYLWSRNPSLNCAALAALLGIKTSSATSYILRAIKAEKGRLGFEPKRMREEVLESGAIPATDMAMRWKSVVQLCELYEAAERKLEIGDLGHQGGKGEEVDGKGKGKSELEVLDEIFGQDKEEEGEVEVEGEGEGTEEVKKESAEDVMKAALEAAEDLDFDDEELNSSSQETVDTEEVERLRKMSRSH
ncbi:unnamed protein product [Sordaria macrospora k-hell]|uniref:WGS project CABT00000000 data, contig 2.11 n=1 Tax=Sordaria macrospora (strain ATCC MYA-333 / DSM 997 / K(L3346) / K-hell) TaxID=771870 RepID=F7VWZ4_SORMK|nr:uncharacterized protein SMAC_02615 [Sordaria macrospora k-hell]CCC10035.1 unnamed protein product [Sordaria macrospora k-hell]